MKKILAGCLSLVAVSLGTTAFAQNATTVPVGAVSVDLPRNSDTRIATPLEQPPVFTGTVSARNGFSISVSPSPSWGSLTSVPHYVQAIDGPQAGIIFDVASNDLSSVTLADNGLEPSGFAVGAKFKLVKYWTLGTLFPVSQQNIAFTPSASTTGVARRTQILFPNTSGTGTNRPANATYFFVTNTFWRSSTATGVNADLTPIPPDSFIIVRNPSTAADGLKLTVSGRVNVDPNSVQLDRLSTGFNDNYVSFSQPVNTTLDNLQLISSGAFTQSASTTGVARRDQLLVYDNSAIAFNKPAAATYYYLNTGTVQGWRSSSNSSADAGATVIPAGSGIVIRKYQSATPTTQFWTTQLTVN